MPDLTGASTIQDLIAVETISSIEYGINTIEEVLRNDLAAWNAVVGDALSMLAVDTTERLERHGASAEGDMLRADEFSAGLTLRQQGGSDVAYPLYKFLRNVGWTLDSLKVATPADLARAQLGVQKAHQRAIYTELRRAFYKPTNFSVADDLIDGQTLNVKRLYNADSDPIPDGPYGETFDGATHDHYNANATLTEAALDAAITDVLEHRQGASVQIVTVTSNIANFEALTNYESLRGVQIVPAEDSDRPIQRFDATQNDNKVVGIYKGSWPVWVKPWGLANYALILDANGERPLKRRQRQQAALRGLRMKSTSQLEPLIVDFFEAEFGFGVWDRSAAAVLQFNNGTYQDPAI